MERDQAGVRGSRADGRRHLGRGGAFAALPEGTVPTLLKPEHKDGVIHVVDKVLLPS